MEEEALSSRLTTQEKLLVSQAVYKLGAVNWEKISGLLENHPVVNGRPKEWFDAKTVEAYYVGLMTEIGINVPAQDAARPQAKVHLRLAQTFYLARLEELKTQIAEHEQTFSRLMSETTAIKSGSMDKVIKDEIRGVLARKFGKKLLDSWVPDEDAVKEALEAGPLSAEAVKAVEGQEGEVAVAEPEKGGAETEIAAGQEKDVEGEDVKAGSAVTEAVDVKAVEQEPEKDEQPQAEGTDIEMAEPTKEASPANDRTTPPPQSAVEVNSPAEKVPDSGAMSPASDLSSAPDDNDQDRPSSPIKQSSSKGGRAGKRKASMQPRGAPVSKRSARRRTTATPGLAGDDSKADEAEAVDTGAVETPAPEPEAEAPVPAEEEVSRRGRRATKRESIAGRGTKKATSPASSTRQSSPVAPKRGQSASSAHSATPATEERRSTRRGPKGRGMRDEVVSKSVREQSAAADSVKGDEEEVDEEENEQEQKQETKPEAEEEEQERPAPRTTRRGRRNASPSPAKGDEEQGEEEEEERPSTRATRRTKDHTTPVPEKQKEVFTERKSTRRSTARGTTHTDDEKPDVEDETTRDRKPSRRPRQSSPREVKANQKMLNNLLDQISGHRNGNIFAQPVRPSDAPNYSEIIKRPMDLKTVRSRIREGQITTIDEFERDVMLIFANATMYNARGSQVHDMAVEMMKDAEGHIKHLKDVQQNFRGG